MSIIIESYHHLWSVGWKHCLFVYLSLSLFLSVFRTCSGLFGTPELRGSSRGHKLCLSIAGLSVSCERSILPFGQGPLKDIGERTSVFPSGLWFSGVYHSPNRLALMLNLEEFPPFWTCQPFHQPPWHPVHDAVRVEEMIPAIAMWRWGFHNMFHFARATTIGNNTSDK